MRKLHASTSPRYETSVPIGSTSDAMLVGTRMIYRATRFYWKNGKWRRERRSCRIFMEDISTTEEKERVSKMIKISNAPSMTCTFPIYAV